ncbi:MAG TPA: BTAD domain-containing putative transcriptional regulator [Pilimelia sp.]|nr:BTAD domain-containing putative transcriptional regulator [Pilimelia sp.]
MTKIRVLGPVEIRYDRRGDGDDLQPLERNLIVVLALGADDARGDRRGGARLGGLTDADLARAVWNDSQATRNVQRAINRINSATSISITRDDRRRYLAWPAHDLDYTVFLDLVAQGRRSDDTRTRFEALDRAMELVRGVPLEGLDPHLGGALRRTRDEITAEVCDAAALWLRAAILLNEKWAVLERACQIQKSFPADETLCELVMYLLYRAGRRARAVECFRTTSGAGRQPVSRRLTELGRHMERNGDVVRATEMLDLRSPSTGEPFPHRFSFAECGEFLLRMLGDGVGERQVIGTTPNNAKAIQDWRPDLIVGINRGGSIVGGMICKHLRLCRVLPVLILWRTDGHGHREYYVAAGPPREADHPDDDPDTVQRILLTDDAFRTGTHVKWARQELQKVFPEADIRVATLIAVRQDVSYGEGPGRGDVGGPTYYGQLVSSRNFELPWDAIPEHR